jgi:sugar lactone lactonase YvrE
VAANPSSNGSSGDERRVGDEPRSILPARCRLGEGPWWDADGDALWFVDLLNHRVHRFSPSTGGHRAYDAPETVSFVVGTRGARMLVAFRRSLAFLDPATGDFEHFASIDVGSTRNRLNDGGCDAAGRLWIGSTAPDDEHGACLWRVDPDGEVTVAARGLGIVNGPGWSPDGRTMYLADSPKKLIHACDFDAERGTLGERRLFADLTAGDAFPDGLAVDEEGCVWSAQWQGSAVIRFAPDGRESGRIDMPVPIATCCCFGGPSLRDLYVTTASVGMDEDALERHLPSGDLFHVSTAVPGLPKHRFGGG